METGVIVSEDGTEKPIKDFTGTEFGGFIQPGESIYLDIEDPKNIPERIPVAFEGNKRSAAGRVFIQKSKLELLSKEYKQWLESLQQK